MNHIELLQSLNAKQREAVTSPATCTIVLAGPGSGKTRTLTYRIAYLISEQNVNPANILAVTFTNKAAREMQERLEGLLGDETAKQVNTRTFHSWGARMLRVEMSRLVPILKEKFFSTHDKQVLKIKFKEGGLRNHFTIYDTAQQVQLMKGVLNQLNLDLKPEEVLSTISSWKNKNQRPDNPSFVKESETNIQLQTWRNCYVLYQAALFEHNACDFDDLILFPLLLFENDSIGQAYQETIKHFLIDEFQDTNEVQYQLSVLLAQQGHIFVVGDEDQAIYGFRHADFKNVQRLIEAYPKHHLILLEQNYRSNLAIVKAANSLITHNTKRVDKKLWTENQGTAKITKFVEADEVEEAKMVATIIKLLHKDGHPYNEIAVLFRINAQSREIEDALRREGIPHRLMQGVGFFERAEVKDVLAYLQFIHNGDLSAFSRIIKTRSGLGKKTEEAILAAPQQMPILSWLQVSYKKESHEVDSGRSVLSWLETYYQQGIPLEKNGCLGRGWNKFAKRQNLVIGGGYLVWLLARDIVKLKEMVPDTPTIALIRQVIKLLEAHINKLPNSNEQLENVHELLTVAKRLEGEGTEGLATFLDEVSLSTDMDRGEGSEDQVILSTMHRSKGLEWDNVIITGAEYNLCPFHRALNEEDGHEEERRLFYVGFTRARKNVYLLRTRTRTHQGNENSNPPSPYLAELGLIR